MSLSIVYIILPIVIQFDVLFKSCKVINFGLVLLLWIAV